MSDTWTIPALKELFDRLIVEHDRRYTERYQAQETALARAREEAKTLSGLLASAFEAYKQAVNEWQTTFRTLKEQLLADAAPKGETLAAIKELRSLIEAQKEEISALRRGESRTMGADEATRLLQAQTTILKAQATRVTALIISTALSLLGLGGTWLFMILR